MGQPAVTGGAHHPGSAKATGKDTVRLPRPAGTKPPATGATLEDYLQQQKPHVEPPPQ
jgi:hypothetical protein